MKKLIDVRYVHAGDLNTNQAHALWWQEGAIGDRYQEIAILGDRVVGSWQYSVDWHRGRCHIDSSHTGVAARLQRRGIAQALWLHGIARWRPTRIKAIIGTNEGRDFLARMNARITYVSPETYLWVTKRKEDEDWDARCEEAARALLRKLGKERIDAATKKLASPAKKLALVAGGTP